MKKSIAVAGVIILTLISLSSRRANAQGMPIDSLAPRLSLEFRDKMLRELRDLIPDYDDQRVWGLAVGDFSNDSLPDLGISLYNLKGPQHQVTVYMFQNLGGRHFQKMLTRPVAYIESPIEVGLLAENSVLTIIQKTGDQHWYQEGFSIESGDVVLVDHFETERQTIPGTKPRYVSHETYRNYESLLGRETYFTGATGQPMFSAKYYTFPAYRRLKNVYPGYGFGMTDTSASFFTEGLGLRKNSADLSIRDAVTSFDDDYLYFSISVNDDNIIGNSPKDEANDRVSLWFDTDPRIDRRVKTRTGGFPTFRDTPDSNLYNVTFILPQTPGKISRVLYSSQSDLNSTQQDAMKSLKAVVSYDSSEGKQIGYTVRARIPFTFLGYETNPVNTYERGGPAGLSQSFDTITTPQLGGLDRKDLEDAPSMGFTALVYDVDDPSHPEEVKVQATSAFKMNDPSSFGTLLLEPTSKFYGEVTPTYEMALKEGLARAGF
jgi:hypothetical protein